MYHHGRTFLPISMTGTVSSTNGGPNMLEQTTPAGWYPNQYGQQQWWDGQQWGVIATPIARAAKETGIAYLLAILLGGFAAHRFYLRDTAAAIGFIILWWGGWVLLAFYIGIPMLAAATIWWIIDMFRMPTMVREANTRP